MKISTAAGQWQAALKAAAPVIDKHASLPLLRTVRLTVSSGKVTVTAHDLDQAIECTLGASDTADGAACVDHATLMSLAGTFPADAPVGFDVRGGVAALKWDGGAAQLPALPADDFPAWPSPPEKTSEPFDAVRFEGNIETVQRAFSAVIPFMSHTDVRYYLHGVALRKNNDASRLLVTATDGTRLCDIAVDHAGDVRPENRPAIIPDFAVRIIAKLPGVTRLETDAGCVHADFTGGRYSARLIDGTYPDVGRVIPQPPFFSAEVNPEELVTALRRAVAIQGGKWRGLWPVSVELAFAPRGTCRIRSGDADNLVDQIIPSAWLEDAPKNPIHVGFNAAYLRDIARAFRGAAALRLSLHPTEARGCAMLVTADFSPGKRVVVMPMRVSPETFGRSLHDKRKAAEVLG